MKKEIFSKFSLNMKNYNEKLEEILDEKNFTEEVQNLILSMFYKIESSYRDFHQVKKESPERDIFISNILFIISEYCNNIEIIKPKGRKNEIEYKISKKSGSIKCFPNEVLLLYCIMQLSEDSNNRLELKEKAVNNILEIGRSLSYQEPIRDFNGWSWTNAIISNSEIQYNLIYQNLTLLIGYEKLEKICKIQNKSLKLKRELKIKYQNELVEEFVNRFIRVSVILKSNEDKKYKENVINYYGPYAEELKKLSNKEQLLESSTEKKKMIIKEIKKIDKILNNISELKKDFVKRNKNLPQSKKIFSISSLEEIYESQRIDYLKQIKQYNKLQDPSTYIKRREELEEKAKFYLDLELENIKKNDIDKEIIKLQVDFLKLFEEKIINCNDKREIIKLIYDFRYYYHLYFRSGYKIKDLEKLKKRLYRVLARLIKKAKELKAMERILIHTTNQVDILDKIMQSQIFMLEGIVCQIISRENKTYIQYYDGNIFEGEIEVKSDEIITKKKKFKLFL